MLPQAANVEHVGATAVPGCYNKGDLDIAVRVVAENFTTAEATLAALLGRNTGSDHMESFPAFKGDAVQPPLGVQLVVLGSPLDVFVRSATCCARTLAWLPATTPSSASTTAPA